MKYRPLLLIALLLCAACSNHNTFYSEAPRDLLDEAKPIYLSQKFLNEGNEEGLMAVLSNDSLREYLKEKKLDPEYFSKLRKLGYDERERRYFSINEWKEFDENVDEAILKMAANLEPNEAIVVVYEGNENSNLHGPAIVVYENEQWKAPIEFKPL